ncbi:helix-turn-helix domain-containing protein [Rhodoferax sp.]|uniref:helix-turn-helix domain-containing protein n=1 Tax=Rhodoferax sp. TaxID=50421 RepID=UPI00272051B5|nr:helix-turn-helix domain-containing protein [Rhodoferax sp.]MDO8318127.1 helix-turn-helix domain-containing protein [Rhodoferax sp.]
MCSSSAIPTGQNIDPALRGACEKSALSVASVLRRQAPAGTSPEILMDFVASLSGVIERTAALLLAGKQVRVIEDDGALTTQEAADLLSVSRPHLVKLLDRGEIPPLPKVGSHRRVARASVLKYKRIRDTQRDAALRELAERPQHH